MIVADSVEDEVEVTAEGGVGVEVEVRYSRAADALRLHLLQYTNAYPSGGFGDRGALQQCS